MTYVKAGKHRRRPKAWALLAGLLAMACLGLAAAVKPPAAKADIPWPYQFMPYIDGYAAYDGQDTCNPSAKPGVVGFRDLLNFWFGPFPTWGISRSCSASGRSEHEEGRALDYNVDARTWGGAGAGLSILNWLQQSDEHGNTHARARRFGIMYIQWNSRIFRMYGPARGQWQFDTSRGCDGHNDPVTHCHIDHMHFSFSWAGANKQTTWWQTTLRNRGRCTSKLQTWVFGSIFGPLVQIKRIEDAYGNVFDTQSEIRNSYWRVQAGWKSYRANHPLSVFAIPRPQALLPVAYGTSWCKVNLT